MGQAPNLTIPKTNNIEKNIIQFIKKHMFKIYYINIKNSSNMIEYT